MAKNNFFAPEMRHDVIETPAFLWFTRIINLFVIIMVTFLFLDYVYFTFIKDFMEINTNCNVQDCLRCIGIDKSAPDTQSRPSHVPQHSSNLSISRNKRRKASNDYKRGSGGMDEIWYQVQAGVIGIFIFCSFVASLIECVNIWSVVDNTENYDCQAIMIAYLIFYHMSKLSLYCVFIISAYITFYGSAFEYSKQFLIGCLIAVGIFGIFVISSSDFAIEGVWVTDPVIWCHIHIRPGAQVQFGIGVWIVGTICLYIFSVILFLRPLLGLMGTMDLSSADKRRRASDSEVNQLITKMVILNGSAIVSSFTSLMIYLFTHFVTAVDLDVGVTAACVILATSKHHKSLYKRLCRRCDRWEHRRRERSLERTHSKRTLKASIDLSAMNEDYYRENDQNNMNHNVNTSSNDKNDKNNVTNNETNDKNENNNKNNEKNEDNVKKNNKNNDNQLKIEDLDDDDDGSVEIVTRNSVVTIGMDNFLGEPRMVNEKSMESISMDQSSADGGVVRVACDSPSVVPTETIAGKTDS